MSDFMSHTKKLPLLANGIRARRENMRDKMMETRFPQLLINRSCIFI